MIPGGETYPFLPMYPAAGPLGLMPLLILGQLNFFAEFDAYFSRLSGIFEVKPK